jgi:hypothetical protein
MLVFGWLWLVLKYANTSKRPFVELSVRGNWELDWRYLTHSLNSMYILARSHFILSFGLVHSLESACVNVDVDFLYIFPLHYCTSREYQIWNEVVTALFLLSCVRSVVLKCDGYYSKFEWICLQNNPWRWLVGGVVLWEFFQIE